MAECYVLQAPLDWDDIPSWGAAVLSGRSLKANLGRLSRETICFTIILLVLKNLFLHILKGMFM
jgi:hypothetical protein